MKPAPNATKCSMTARPRAARRVTASAPITLPSAATSAYTRALDTGQQVALGVALRVLQHLGEHVVPVHREVLQRQGLLGGADGFDLLRKAGNGTRETGIV